MALNSPGSCSVALEQSPLLPGPPCGSNDIPLPASLAVLKIKCEQTLFPKLSHSDALFFIFAVSAYNHNIFKCKMSPF